MRIPEWCTIKGVSRVLNDYMHKLHANSGLKIQISKWSGKCSAVQKAKILSRNFLIHTPPFCLKFPLSIRVYTISEQRKFGHLTSLSNSTRLSRVKQMYSKQPDYAGEYQSSCKQIITKKTVNLQLKAYIILWDIFDALKCCKIQVDGKVDRRTDGWMVGWMDGWMDIDIDIDI